MAFQKRDQAEQLLGPFVPGLAEELEIPYEPLGMTTRRKADGETARKVWNPISVLTFRIRPWSEPKTY